MIERRPESFYRLASEHGAHRFNGDGNHQRDWLAEVVAQLLNGEDAGLDVARILTSFQEKDVRAAFDKAVGLFVIIISKLFEADAAGDADSFGGGTHRACDETRLAGGREIVRSLARKCRSYFADFASACAQPVLCEHNRCAAEGIRFNDVGAGFEIFAMGGDDDISTGDHEVVVRAV